MPPPPPPKPAAATVSELIRPNTLPQTLVGTTYEAASQPPPLTTTDNANNNLASVDNPPHDESPEKLSLKARLKLFEKEIEQQGSTVPAPRPGKFLICRIPGTCKDIIKLATCIPTIGPYSL